MTLEERIKQMLEESTKQTEVAQEEVVTESIMTRVADLISSKEAIAQHVKDQSEKVANSLANHPSVANHPQKTEIVQKIKTHLGASKNLTDFTKRAPGVIDILKSHSVKNVSESLINLDIEPLTEEDLEAMPQEEFDSIDEDQLDEKEGVNYTLGNPIDKKNVYKVHRKDTFTGKDTSNKDDVYHSLEDAKKVAGNMSRSGNTTKITMHPRTKLAGPVGKLPESLEVSSQVASLLEAEGLSEEFKVQAVTIFEAAVTDRVLQIQEELEAQYNEKLDEAKAEIETNIDGFLNEAVQAWADNNEVAIQSNFKTRLAESFMDGLQSLLAEHNIDLPAESENALDIALEEVSTLEAAADEVQTTIAQLQEQVNVLKAEKILESFKEKMTSTEFDRFAQLTESVKFKDESQYEKQLNIVLENFGKITQKPEAAKPAEVVVEQIVEDTLVQTAPVIKESYSSVNRYAAYLTGKK